MSNVFYVGQTDYIDQFNILADRVMTNGISFGSLSITTAPASGTGALSYALTGAFTFTPPDTYTTSELDASLALKANIASPTFTGTVGGITKAMVGLGNLDNTSDLLKPISTATTVALALKANIASPTFTGTVGGITKAMVGLGNVDNTSDAAKPVSTATATALSLKANIASPTFTGTVSGITKAMVGLTNADDTTDLLKPLSTASINALALKAPISSPTFLGTVSGITKAMVGLANVDNTADLDKAISTLTAASILAERNRAMAAELLLAPQSTTYNKTETDNRIAAVVGAAPAALDTLIEIGNQLAVDESAVTALTTVVGLKAPLLNPVFTGTVIGITKAMVGLGNVDNISDLNKPINNLTALSILAEKNRALAAEALLAPQLTTYTKLEIDNKISNTIAIYSFIDLIDKPTTIVGYGITDAFTGNIYNPINVYDTTASTSATTGALTVSGGVGIQGNLYLGSISNIKALIETATILSIAAPGTISYFDVNTQSILYYTVANTTNFTLYIRGSSTITLNNSMSVGQSITIALLVTNGANAYYPNVVSIDGTSITPKWANGLPVTSGTVSSIDAYTYTCIKTAASTFTVLASRSKFS